MEFVNNTGELQLKIPEDSRELTENVLKTFDLFLKSVVDMNISTVTSNESENRLREIKKEIERKDEKINSLTAEIKSKDELIITLYALIKSNDALKETQTHIAEMIRNITSEMNKTNNEIFYKDTSISSLNKQIEEKNEELKKNSEATAALNKKLLSCLNNINQKNYTLIEVRGKEEEIKRKDELLNKKDEEFQDKFHQAKGKDAQNTDLNRQNNVISQNFTKTNEKHGKWNEIKSCLIADEGIFHIKLPEVSAFEAPCNGRGWMIIQRRIDGSVDFSRNWTDYKDGFGNLTGEFFLGLEKLHLITKSRQHELLIRLGKVDGSTSFALYDDFRIGSEEKSYPLESIEYSKGDAGDSLEYLKNMKFSTFDRDNDISDLNYADLNGGGWWFKDGSHSSLNGIFIKDGKWTTGKSGIIWGSWHKFDYFVSLTFVEMMIRPALF
ncbi:uncharacterized protein Dana_GF26769 [Drosophila ananassae]|uniref:Fibrinogen C-terminal domain-containing protein n=2 Tax=Drosophila ananassae TaxID=7217 RepID=A0A0P8XHM4_DROAN|nr:uncharacterized protein Dana_GF26769 [Drosophila ananassae]